MTDPDTTYREEGSEATTVIIVTEADPFDSLGEDIEVTILDDRIVEESCINGVDYTLTVDLSKWDGKTTREQLAECSRVFWYCYPRMYERFGVYADSPTDVILAVENEGYEIAEAWDNHVHIHDMWLSDNPGDYDCLTHEFAHVIQNGWDGDRLEYDSYIERFADYCRYIYAYDQGYYNDEIWDLQTVATESDRESSVRFLVWMDYACSMGIKEEDLMLRFFRVCHDGSYEADDWDRAWEEIFKGTRAEGMTVDQVWQEYIESDFAYLDSHAERGQLSDLLSSYGIRDKIRGANEADYFE